MQIPFHSQNVQHALAVRKGFIIKKILIIDDNEDIHKFLTVALQSHYPDLEIILESPEQIFNYPWWGNWIIVFFFWIFIQIRIYIQKRNEDKK